MGSPKPTRRRPRAWAGSLSVKMSALPEWIYQGQHSPLKNPGDLFCGN